MGIFDWLRMKLVGDCELEPSSPSRPEPAPPPSPRHEPQKLQLSETEVNQRMAQLGLKAHVTTIERNELAWNMDHPVGVSHPSRGRGGMRNYDARIERIDYRVEKEVGGGGVFADWTFRGESRCHEDNVTRKKTFFASMCGPLVDGVTGEVISGRDAIAEWLQKLGSDWRKKKEEDERDAAVRGLRDGDMAKGLGRDVIVRYPVYGSEGCTDEVHEFRVTVDVISRWSNTIRFHGKAKRAPIPGKRAWSGTKTFYTRDIVSLADPETGPVHDIEAYLENLAQLGPR